MLCLSGRGDKDLAEVLRAARWTRGAPTLRPATRDGCSAAFAAAFAAPRARAALMPYMMGGFPDHETSLAVAAAYADAGADLIELGVPFSDPLADGPTIHAAATAALDGGRRRSRRRSRSARGRRSGSRSC